VAGSTAVCSAPPEIRRQHVHGVARADGAGEFGLLPVDEQQDVLTDAAVLVEHPAGQTGVAAFELLDHLADGGALDLELLLSSGQLPEGRTQRHHGHGSTECTAGRGGHDRLRPHHALDAALGWGDD